MFPARAAELLWAGRAAWTPVPPPQKGALQGDKADAQGQRHTSTPQTTMWKGEGGAAGAPGPRVLTLTHPALPQKPENQLRRQAR